MTKQILSIAKVDCAGPRSKTEIKEHPRNAKEDDEER